MGFYPHFILPAGRSRGFASTAPDSSARLGLAFAAAPRQRRLTSPVTVSRRIIMQKARRHPNGAPTACRRVVSGSLASPHGVLPIVRSRYWFAIGRQGVLSLAGWAPQIRAHFHVLSATQVPPRPSVPRLRGCHPLRPAVPGRSAQHIGPKRRSYYPAGTSPGGLGYSPFARRYWGSRGCFLFLGVLRCFSSPGCPGTPASTPG
jgi:hypothetical protein